MQNTVSQIQTRLKDLPYCGVSIRAPKITLPREGEYQHLACLWDESFPSASAAQRTARNCFLTLYEAVGKQMETFGDAAAPEGMPLLFQTAFCRSLLLVREAVLACRTAGNSAAVNRICTLLTPESVTEELAQLASTLSSRCVPAPFSDCCARIRYDVNDPSQGETGLAWLAAKAFRRYGYDLLPAVRWLEDDGNARMQSYARAFAAQAAIIIEAGIVMPVQAKLPLLERP